MSLEPKTGNPSADGRYVAFVRCQAQGASEWVEPVIMTWHGGKWHTGVGQRKILGWLGPLPVMKVSALEPLEYAGSAAKLSEDIDQKLIVQEFDL